MRNSKLILLDEFTNSLDQITTQRIISILKEIKQNYMIIIITHDSRVLPMADRVILLDNGKVREVPKKTEYKNLSKIMESTQKF